MADDIFTAHERLLAAIMYDMDLRAMPPPYMPHHSISLAESRNAVAAATRAYWELTRGRKWPA